MLVFNVYPSGASTSTISYLPSSSSIEAWPSEFVTISDRKVKKNIKTNEFDGLKIVNNIKVKSYDLKIDDGHVNYGFIAQEVRDADYQYTNNEKDHNIVINNKEKDELGIDYNQLTAVLWKAVQELSAQVNELKAEIKQLKSA